MNIKKAHRIGLALFGGILGTMPVDAQWVKLGGPDSVRAFAYGNVKVEGVTRISLFAGTQKGVFRSIDDGTTWVAINSGLTNLSVRGIVVLRDTLYAATRGDGVFQSGNGGASWNTVNTGLANLNLRTLYGYGTDLFVGTEAGEVFHSVNRGAGWNTVGSGLPNATVNALSFYSGSLYAGTDSGIFIATTNGGGTWSSQNPGLANRKVNALLWDGSFLYSGTEGGAYALRMNRSPDPGWKLEALGSTSPPAVLALSSPDPYTDVITPLLAGTEGQGAFFRASSAWAAINEGLVEMDIQAAGVSNQYLFIGTDGGVWRRPMSQVYTSVRMPGRNTPMHFRINENGVFSFSLPVGTFVSLKVFSLQGKLLHTLIHEDLAAGDHTRQTDLPNGIYLFSLQSGGGTETRKLALLR